MFHPYYIFNTIFFITPIHYFLLATDIAEYKSVSPVEYKSACHRAKVFFLDINLLSDGFNSTYMINNPTDYNIDISNYAVVHKRLNQS